MTLPAQIHSDTSCEAAELARPNAKTQRQRVLAFVRSMGRRGATDEQIQAGLGMNPSTERPRRIELQAAGLVAPRVLGKRADGRPLFETRPTRSGRKAVVWVAAEHLRGQLELL